MHRVQCMRGEAAGKGAADRLNCVGKSEGESWDNKPMLDSVLDLNFLPFLVHWRKLWRFLLLAWRVYSIPCSWGKRWRCCFVFVLFCESVPVTVTLLQSSDLYDVWSGCSLWNECCDKQKTRIAFALLPSFFYTMFCLSLRAASAAPNVLLVLSLICCLPASGFRFPGSVKPSAAKFPSVAATTKFPDSTTATRFPNTGAITKFPDSADAAKFPNAADAGTKFPELAAAYKFPNATTVMRFPEDKLADEKDEDTFIIPGTRLVLPVCLHSDSLAISLSKWCLMHCRLWHQQVFPTKAT